jgi:uncharacterized protein
MSKFLVSVHDLMNRSGLMREHDLKITLDEPMGIVGAELGKGDVLEIGLRLESVHEGILATAVIDADAHGECSRCLDKIEIPIEVDFQELFAYSGVSEDDFTVVEEQIDLEQIIRDEVVLSLPFQPVCSPDCQGLCPECGVKLQDNPGHAHEEQVDARWSELMNFRNKEE